MSNIFYALLCWDMASDRIQWKESIWMPLTAIVIPLAMWICDYILRKYNVNLNIPCLVNIFKNTLNSYDDSKGMELPPKLFKNNIPNSYDSHEVVVSPLNNNNIVL
jgi:hypothetical protein